MEHFIGLPYVTVTFFVVVLEDVCQKSRRDVRFRARACACWSGSGPPHQRVVDAPRGGPRPRVEAEDVGQAAGGLAELDPLRVHLELVHHAVDLAQGVAHLPGDGGGGGGGGDIPPG